MTITQPAPRTSRHRLTLTRSQARSRATFQGRCDCGATSGQQSTAGLVHGWHGTHVDGLRLPAFVDRPEPGTYEAALLRRRPGLASLVLGGPDSFRGGAR